jgi:hypothetical protein
MTEQIEDLSPFFEDLCWMCVLLARHASVGIILRRGPTQWWHVTLWNTKSDTFEGGQWFRAVLTRKNATFHPTGSCSSTLRVSSVLAMKTGDIAGLGPQ